MAQPGREYDVTVTNLTSGIVLTPMIAASHKADVHTFMLGESASVQLEEQAEGGSTAGLMSWLAADPDVLDIKTSGAIPPGQSVTVTLQTTGNANHISVTQMLVPTNDAFTGVSGVAVPKGNDALVLHVPAYDAGTEANDELCEHIPGPPDVCMGEGFNPSRDGAEGFVHVHRGIHGVGDLNAATFDWRNPVARIVIKRHGSESEEE